MTAASPLIRRVYDVDAVLWRPGQYPTQYSQWASLLQDETIDFRSQSQAPPPGIAFLGHELRDGCGGSLAVYVGDGTIIRGDSQERGNGLISAESAQSRAASALVAKSQVRL